MGIAGDLIIVVVAAFVGGLVAQRLRLPLLVGYILAGVVVGPYTAGPTVSQTGNITLLADIGVALLLFTIGLDFPLHRLRPVRRAALVGTPIQLLATIALGLTLGAVLHWHWTQGLWLGALLSLSSTAVVLRLLSERGLSGSLASRVMLGILIVQDLAVVPLTILLPELAHLGQGLAQLGWAALRAAVFIAAMTLFGTRVFPRLMAIVARRNSRELFLIAVAAIGLGVGYASYRLGLSFAFGAFVAGMVLSESEYSHQALFAIAPLRDVFAMVFFVSVGMLIDPRLVWQLAPLVALVIAALLLVKGGILALVVRVLGYGNVVPLAVGLGLFQIGEFSFVLARSGIDTGALSAQAYAVVLTSAVVTMALTPLVAGGTEPAYRWWRRLRRTDALANIPTPVEADLRDHVLLCGFGRVGRVIAWTLRALGAGLCIIDLDLTRAENARAAGFAVVYGDASAEPVLVAAGLHRAAAVVLALPDAAGLAQAAARIRALRPDVRVISRAGTLAQVAELSAIGIPAAVQPEVEGGIALVHQILSALGVSEERCRQIEAQARTGLRQAAEGPA